MIIKTSIDLNSCVPGQQVKLRDGRIVTYKGLIDDNILYTHNINGYSYVSNGKFWAEDCTESKADVVEILSMEDKSVEIVPEITHSITDQIDVTSPDHVSIIPHEHGVTISIKKGLTTISWRYSNS